MGPSYDVFLTSFYQTHQLIPERDDSGRVIKKAVTFDDAVIAAGEEEQAQQFAKRSKETTALIARSLDSVWFCNYCHEKGHLQENCWKLHPDRKKAHDERKRVQRQKGDEIKEKKAETIEEAVAGHTSTLAYQSNSAWYPETETHVTLVVSMLPATSPQFASFINTQTPNLLEDNMLIDTGCNNHVLCRKEVFMSDTLVSYQGQPVNGFGGSIQQLEMTGTARIPCETGGSLVNLFLRNTLYHPKAGCDIVPPTQLRRAGADLAFCH